MKRNILLTITILSYILWSCSGSSHTDGEAHEHSDHIEEHDHEHSEHEGHDHEAEGHGDEIILKKAEAEAIGLTTKTIKPEKFHSVIPCSGTLSAAQGDEMTVVAPVSGVVSLAGRHITDGSQVSKGSVLLRLSAQKLAAGDPAQRAHIDYETARKAYDRASELVKDQYTFLMEQLEKVLKDYFDLSARVKEMHTEIFSLREQLAQAATLQCVNKECLQRTQSEASISEA